jgi:predicted enzyme related to lactoylglutathione lyase
VADFASHKPGTFSWPELATTDQAAGVAFYRALFGWALNEQPMGPGDTYSMFQMRDKPVAAAYTMRADERSMGIPPHWNSYVTVADVDESAKKATSLGAKVLAPPFDVMDAGRMAVIQDPSGAVFQVWQAKRSIGAMILNEPGALCWTELNSRDTKAAEAFYTQMFGWSAKHSSPGSPMEYTEFSNDGTPSIGMMPINEHMPAHVPSYWMPYFQVASADASVAKIQELGGKIMVPAQDIPGTGRFAIGSDPQGAMFAVFEYTEKK